MADVAVDRLVACTVIAAEQPRNFHLNTHWRIGFALGSVVATVSRNAEGQENRLTWAVLEPGRSVWESTHPVRGRPGHTATWRSVATLEAAGTVRIETSVTWSEWPHISPQRARVRLSCEPWS
jgi:hypothetical protein